MNKRISIKLYLIAGIIVAGAALLAAKPYVSRVGDRLYSCLRLCAAGNTRDDDVLRLVTLNLYHGYPEFRNLKGRLELIAHELDRMQADIVFLQEVPWKSEVGLAAEYLGRSAGFNYAYFRANGNYALIRFEEGLAILSRYPLRDPHFMEVLPKPGGFENRALLSVTADTAHGPVRLVTTHLSRRRDEQTNAAQTVSLKRYVDSLGPVPVIIAGDFNALEHSPQVISLNASWTDAFRVTHPEKAGFTCCLSREALDAADAGTPFVRLDYIFLASSAQDWRVVSAETVFDRPGKRHGMYQWVSNHIGVRVDLRPPVSLTGRKY